jgi:2-phospho-L-lactate/phosphoenolpyruvate guanylyltransferase
VLIPVRALEGAKSRLGEVLDAEERRELVARLLHGTIGAARATPGVTLVAVVSPDAEVLAMAADAGAAGIHQATSGLNPAIVEAREALAGTSDRLLVLPGDLPGIRAEDVAAVLRAGDEAATRGGAVVVVAPDRHGRGTNALLLEPPDVIDPAFGTDSRQAHARLAAAAGAAWSELPGVLELDVDTPDDLLLAEERTPEALRAG